MSRILAIDYGEKRLGIALSDETQKIAHAYPFIPASEPEKLLRLLVEQEVERVLVGLPKNLEGQETKSARQVRKFAAWLTAQSGLAVELIDERFTTRQAREMLRTQKLNERKGRNLIDSLSAQILLQAYLQNLKK